MYFGVVSPGKMNENILFTFSDDLRDIYSNLLLDVIGLADKAYKLAESMLLPFTGADHLNPAMPSTITFPVASLS